MDEFQKLKFSIKNLRIPLLFVFIIWFVYWIEIQFSFNFNHFGVFPRTLNGFKGVFFTSFIHSDTKHLFNNSVPLFVLLTALFYFYKDVAYKVLLLGGFFTGFLTWIFAREAYHIGASGVVYLLFSFVFFSGIIKKHLRLIALSLAVIFLYGSMIWYVFPIKDGMSWEGHLSGFFVGLLFAIYYKNKGITKTEFEYVTSNFDDFFDEDGNLITSEIDEVSKEDVLEKK